MAVLETVVISDLSQFSIAYLAALYEKPSNICLWFEERLRTSEVVSCRRIVSHFFLSLVSYVKLDWRFLVLKRNYFGNKIGMISL